MSLNIEIIKPTIGAIIHDVDLNTTDENTTQPEPEVMGNNIKETNKDTPPTEDVSSPAFSDDDIPF